MMLILGRMLYEELGWVILDIAPQTVLRRDG